MSNLSVLKRERKNIKKKIYNKYKYKTVKTLIKKFKKDLIIKKIDNYTIKKKINYLFSILDKLKNKKILHFNKVSRIKSKLSNLINKFLAH